MVPKPRSGTMAVSASHHGPILKLLLHDLTRSVSRELTVDPSSVIPDHMIVSAPEHGGLPTLISVERIIAKVNRSGFSLVDERSKLVISDHLNTNYISQSSTCWVSSSLRLMTSVMKTRADQEVGEFVGALRRPLLPGAEQFNRACINPDPDAVPRLADSLLQTTRSSLTPYRPTWIRRAADVGTFIGRCALEGIISTIFGAPVEFFIEEVFT